MLLIVMYESGTWRAKPAQRLTFGRAATCDVVLPNEDRGVSRNAGSLDWRHGAWWLTNSSASSMLYLTGDRGFRADIPPGMGLPLQQWHAKVRLDGVLDSYTLRMRLPDLDEADEDEGAAGHELVPERQVTSTRLRAPLGDADRLVLAARFEDYLTWKHSGVAVPRSARDAAARIGWDAHAVSKRCENIRNRYVRIGVPGLRGPRALEELAALLISTGELTTDDLRRLPPTATRPTAAVRPAPAAATAAATRPTPPAAASTPPAPAATPPAPAATAAAPDLAAAASATPTPTGVTRDGVTRDGVTRDGVTPDAELATPSPASRP
jgi:predicted component of type VI protein secretion system